MKGCPPLALITLELLGLNIDISPITVEITGDTSEGILGDILCALAGLGGGGNGPLRNVLRSLFRALTRLLEMLFP
jgi:hypothetical protein